jgi:O-antigen/teichoic acid export membrane protein
VAHLKYGNTETCESSLADRFMTSVITRLKALLPKGQFARSVTVLAGGTALHQGLVMLASPLLTRLYTPEDFGILAIYAAILGIVSIAASLRYEFAIPLPEDEITAANILALSFLLVIGMSSLMAVVIWLYGSNIINLLDAPDLQPYLWLLPVGLLLVGFYQALNYWAVRKKAFGLISSTKVTQGISSVTVQLGFGLLQFGPLGLIFGHILKEFAGVGSFIRAIFRSDRAVLRQIRLSSFSVVLRRYQRFPKYTVWAGMANAMSLHLPALLLAVLFSQTTAGLYMLTQKVIGLPMNLLGRSIGQVFHADAAASARQDKIAESTLDAFCKLLRVGVGPFLLLSVTGPDLFQFVFGDEWRVAGIFAQWLAPLLLVVFITSPISTLASVLEYQAHALGLQLMLLTLRVIAISTGAYLGDAFLTIALYSGFSLLAYIIFIVWLMHIAGVKLRDWLIPLLKEVIVLVPVVAAALAIRGIFWNFTPEFALLGVTVSTGLIGACVAYWRMRPIWR